LEFAEKVAGHELDYRALARVTGLKFIDLNKDPFTGAGDFTISYDYIDPANHIIFIGESGVREDKDSKAAQWFIEPILKEENVFGAQDGAAPKDPDQLAKTGEKFYQTLYVDFPFEVDGVNTKAYYGKTLNGNTLEMEEVGTLVPARTPVLMEYESASAVNSQCTPFYDKDDLKRNVYYAMQSIYEIERTLLRRKPTLSRWAGYYMANTDKWYFAYTIDGDTITIVDACHAQNMHQS
jgi:hypothetical protein